MQEVTVEELASLITERQIIGHLTSHWKKVLGKEEYPETTIGACYALAYYVRSLLCFELGVFSEVIEVDQGTKDYEGPHYITEIPGQYLIDTALSQNEWETPKEKRNIPNIIIQEITPKESLAKEKGGKK